MNARRLATVFVLAAVFLPAGERLSGQQAPPAAPAQGQGRNPLTTAEHLRLAFLVGRWEEQVSYTSAKPEENKGTGRWAANPALGLYLQIRYEATSPAGPYRAFGVMTWDRDAQVYRLWWFDDAALVGEYRGNFTDENNLVFLYSGLIEGQGFRERIRFTRVSPSELRTKIEQSWGNGEFKPYLEAVAHRIEGPGRGAAQRPPQN